MRVISLLLSLLAWLVFPACAAAIGGAPIAGGYVSYYQIPVVNWDNLAVANCQTLEPWANCQNTLVTRSLAGTPFSAPVTISAGGTYTLNALSASSSTPVVTITTSSPVRITGSILVGAGVIVTNPGGASLQFDHNQAWGIGTVPAQLINAGAWGSYLTINDNVFSNLWGIFVNGASGTSVVTAYSNVAYDLTSASGSLAHFLQLNNGTFPSAQIYSNTVINAPFHSTMDDGINITKAVCTSGVPCLIYGNNILGAYAANPATGGTGACGINLDGSSGDTVLTATQWWLIYSNSVFNTSNCGISTAGGHDNQIYGNTIISSGIIGGSLAVAAQNNGLQISNQSGETYGTVYFNNAGFNNTLYWLNAFNNTLHDAYNPDCDAGYGGGCANINPYNTTTFAGALAIEAGYVQATFGRH